MELLEKLAALVPPTLLHLLRYPGVLAPRVRDRIVPVKPAAERRGGRRCERCLLRPSAAGGDPAGAGVFRRPQRMLGLWRSPENHRRPDRSGLDPDLSGVGLPAMPPPRALPVPLSSSPPDLPGGRLRIIAALTGSGLDPDLPGRGRDAGDAPPRPPPEPLFEFGA